MTNGYNDKTEMMEVCKMTEEMKDTQTQDAENSERKAVPWWKSKRAQYGMIAGACALVIASGGVAIAANQGASVEQDTQTETPITAEPVEEKESVQAEITVDLPEWNSDSTPVLLEVNDGVSTSYTTIDANNAGNAKLDLGDGTFTVTTISPINSDGSIYVVSDPVTVNKDTKTVPVTGTKVSADNVTEDQINAIKDAFNKAKDAGKVTDDVVNKVTNNANAGTDARNSKSDEEKQAAQETAKQETQSKQENNNSGSNSGSTTSTPASTPAASSGSNNSGSSSGSSSSSSQSQQSTPAHEHSWTPVYKTVHHDAVTEQQPIYETVGVCVCNVCGVENPGRDHEVAHMKAHEGCGTHEEYKSQITGYNTVVKTAAYDEQVISGYSCSCGATK